MTIEYNGSALRLVPSGSVAVLASARRRRQAPTSAAIGSTCGMTPA